MIRYSNPHPISSVGYVGTFWITFQKTKTYMQVFYFHSLEVGSTTRFPGFPNGDEKENAKSSEPVINSEGICAHCSPASKTAKLLIVTGQWNFYYCYRCRRWSQSYYSAKSVLLPIENSRMEKSLTWFWKTEEELMHENLRAMEWIRSIFTGGRRSYGEDNSKLI